MSNSATGEKLRRSKERLQKLERDLADLQEQSQKLKAQWQNEKGVVDEIRSLKSAMEMSKEQIEQAKREGNLNKASEIQYGRLPELEKKLQAADQKLSKLQKTSKMLTEEVTENDIAEVVAAWTGIPVSVGIASTKTLAKVVSVVELLTSERPAPMVSRNAMRPLLRGESNAIQ